ncbi:50S ribosomal protein L9 [Candidatus Kaiserbacteria bacterium]|nr:MAG: 50S ribosomal protein L9 [Candidatus Kaiserbacteria bacterium]
MKVILIKDVARLGRKSEVKDVPDGHALNFLIPKKLAIIATPEQLRRVSEVVRQQDSQQEALFEAFKAACAKLAEKQIPYTVEANEKGHLFKGISVDDILAHLEATESIVLSKQSMHLAHPIKELGVHQIPLSFSGISGVCTLVVVKK